MEKSLSKWNISSSQSQTEGIFTSEVEDRAVSEIITYLQHGSCYLLINFIWKINLRIGSQQSCDLLLTK